MRTPLLSESMVFVSDFGPSLPPLSQCERDGLASGHFVLVKECKAKSIHDTEASGCIIPIL